MSLVALMASAVVLGSLVFLGLVLAPAAVATLDGRAAERLLGAVVPRLYALFLVCSAVGLVASLSVAAGSATVAALTSVLTLGALAALSAYALRLIPRIGAAQACGAVSRSRALNRQAAWLNTVALLLATGAFALAAASRTPPP